ncbi:hypothetical protein [Rhizobium redzepovicii]|uniref:hypothetical protein n=1 Tax=Rhizobium redzepovicii TaxID=2867518 RepID=UPI002870EAA7|nr:hypothetical protein [Rhizobium redzepovicii]MDR9782145.1 hypothetical protein [Rhizobium redzepovicii]
MNIFWSWQSDTPSDTNRNFIREALVAAIAMVAEEISVEEAPRPQIDHDTKSTAGMADIVDTIFGKISNSAAFVADVTPVAVTDKGKAVPNPNVMIELGWAMRKPGAGHIIAILNTAQGFSPDDLPFDLRQRRVLTYSLANDTADSEKDRKRKKLTAALKTALSTNLRTYLQSALIQGTARGLPPNRQDRSIWEDATAEMTFKDGSKVQFPSLPRIYMRVIPSFWPKGVRKIRGVKAKFDMLLPNGRTQWRHRKETDRGYVAYSIAGKNATSATELVYYHFETGEFWIQSSEAFIGRTQHTATIGYKEAVTIWSNFLQNANFKLSLYGASAERRIEVGAVGLRSCQWPAPSSEGGNVATTDAFAVSMNEHVWTKEKKIKVLELAANKLFSCFGFREEDESSFRDFLFQIAPELSPDYEPPFNP